MTNIALRVNGESHQIDVDPDTPLLFVLRNYLGLTGAKLGCGLEQCGACAVLVDGQSTLSCSAAVSDFQDKVITTVEGLARENQLSRVQQAFIGAGAAQCGYCIPGMLVSAYALLAKNPTPSLAEIKDSIGGNLCRCTGYVQIIEAIELAAQRLQKNLQ